MTSQANVDTRPHRTKPVDRVVAVVDETYESGEALRWADHVAHRLDADVTVVESWQPGFGEFADAVQGAARVRRRADLITWAQAFAVEPGAAAFDVLRGESPSSIERYLGDEPGHLVVVGVDPPASAPRHARSLPLRRLVHELRHPLAIVPTAGAHRPLQRVVVGVDGSPTSMAACEWCAAVAARVGAEVHLVTVFEPFLETTPKTARGSVWRWVDDQVERHWASPFRAEGVAVQRHVVEGTRPADAIATLALRVHANAVVVGASGVAGRFQLHRGVTALHVAHGTGLATVMVPERSS